ncbi:hypothetical protein BSYN_09220 [Bacteroides sedimenti]|uniref:Transposase n=1 Tax=Bacteroides sedimenti TaxID=2136147 RepID=A0ABM8IGM1_9BACE
MTKARDLRDLCYFFKLMLWGIDTIGNEQTNIETFSRVNFKMCRLHDVFKSDNSLLFYYHLTKIKTLYNRKNKVMDYFNEIFCK